MKSDRCTALLGEIISFECRQKLYPKGLKKEKAKQQIKSKAEKNDLDPKEILIYHYKTKGVICDSVNCVIEKATRLVR